MVGFSPTHQGEISFWSQRVLVTDLQKLILICVIIWSPTTCPCWGCLPLSLTSKGSSEVTTWPPWPLLAVRATTRSSPLAWHRRWNTLDRSIHSHKGRLGTQYDVNQTKTAMRWVKQKFHTVWPLSAREASRTCSLRQGHLRRPFQQGDRNQRSMSGHTQVTQLSELSRPTVAAVVEHFVLCYFYFL